MITVKLLGGLGNQLSQYGFAHALSVRLQTRVEFDLIELGRRDVNHTIRDYALDRFPRVRAELRVTPRTKALNHRNALVRRLARLPLPRRFQYVRQQGLLLPDLPWRSERDYYLDGYFVGHRHLEPIRAQLLQELADPRIETRAYARLLAEIRAAPCSVFVHVRRGDYFTPALVNQYGICTEQYYAAALATIRARLGEGCRFFVFSDDIAWVQAHLQLPGDSSFVSAAGLPPHEELLLMAACRNGIIANSTFSWWGAWLIVNPEKVIITPNEWLRNPAVPHHIDDLLPPQWTRIKVSP